MNARPALTERDGQRGELAWLELIRAAHPVLALPGPTGLCVARDRLVRAAVVPVTGRSGAGRWSPRTVTSSVLALAVAVAAAAVTVVLQTAKGVPGNYLDLLVYREAVIAWHTGHPVYDSTFTFADLPFTYPPFGLLPLSWTLLVSPRTAGLAQLSASLAGLAVLSWGSVRTGLAAARRRSVGVLAGPLRGPAAPVVAASAVFTGGLLLEPVTHTLDFGQVNLVIAAAVLTDCLLVPPRWRGLLTGIATATKLTPGVFVGYLLLTGQRDAAWRWAGGLIGATAVGAMLAPGDSLRYWTMTVLHNRTGPVDFAGNQNWAALITRIITDHLTATVATLFLDAATLVVGALAVTRATRLGYPVTAVSVTGLTGLLVSPVSWSHHWVWAIPLLAALLLERPVRAAARWAVLVTAVFATAPFWHPTAVTAALGWIPPAVGLVANSYVVATAAILVAVAIGTCPGSSAPRIRGGGELPGWNAMPGRRHEGVLTR